MAASTADLTTPDLDFDAVIFDMDGTLTDSEHWWDEVRRGLATDAGAPWTDTATTDMMGQSTQEWATYLIERVGLTGPWQQVAQATIAGMLNRYHTDGIPLLPGADKAVRRIANAVPVAICSSSPRVLIETVVTGAGWVEVFNTIVSTEECDRGKPSPDGYLRAAELLGFKPERCVVIEDSTQGLRAAMAANMMTVAIPPQFHPPSPELLSDCNLVLQNLDQLTIEVLAQMASPS